MAYDPRALVPFIRETAAKYGINPDVAVKVAESEGLNQFTSGIPGENSYGAFQLYTQGGLGNEFQKETGLDPSDPKNEQATIDYALKHAATHGWGAFHGAKNRYGYGPWVGIGGNPDTASLPPDQPAQPTIEPQKPIAPQPLDLAQSLSPTQMGQAPQSFQLPAFGFSPTPQQPAPSFDFPIAPPLNAPPAVQDAVRQLNLAKAFQKIPLPPGFRGFVLRG